MRSEIAAVLDRAYDLPTGRPVTIVFADAAYAAVLETWIGHALRAGASSILVLAFDQAIERLARDAGVATRRLLPIASRQALWMRRIEVFTALADAGIDFIHSDADALWLGSPYDMLAATGADLTFSQGTIWPPDIVRDWGFVLCCGFFAVRANAAVSAFFRQVGGRMVAEADDQIAVNRALRECGIEWEPADPVETRYWRSLPFRTFERSRLGWTGGISVALLPHRLVPRLGPVSTDALVRHLIEEKVAAAPLRGVAGLRPAMHP